MSRDGLEVNGFTMSTPITNPISKSTATTSRATALATASLLQKLGGYVNTQLLYVIAKLGIADFLADGPKSSTTLADELHVPHDPLHRILRGAVNCGLLIEVEPGRFATTRLTQLLESSRSDSWRDYAILSGEEWYRAWGALLQAVEGNRTPFEVVFGYDYYTHLTKKPDAGTRFNQFMQTRTKQSVQALIEAYDFSAATVVVDIGGGNGTLLHSLLSANPHLHGILYDLPTVVAEAEQTSTVQELGVRCQLIGGNFMQNVPMGGDLYMLSQILHNWNDEECLQLLRNCFDAMAPHDRLLILEQIIPAELKGHMPAVEMDLMMLVLLHGRERTVASYDTLLLAAGFEITSLQPLKRLGFSIIEAQKR